MSHKIAMLHKTVFVLLLVSLVGCGKPLWYVHVTKDTLHEKMSLYPNDETVSWWYTGNDGTFHYFVMEKDASWPDDGYKVAVHGISFREPKKFDLTHGVGRDEWVPARRDDFDVLGSELERMIRIPDQVRDELEGLTQRPELDGDDEDYTDGDDDGDF